MAGHSAACTVADVVTVVVVMVLVCVHTYMCVDVCMYIYGVCVYMQC